MNKIDVNTIWLRPVADFKATVYTTAPKPVVFWDTCALLNVIRFIYREKGDYGVKFDCIKHVHDQIMAGNIYSVTSEIVIKEWNEHIDKTLVQFKESLIDTSRYHQGGIIVCNRLNGTAHSSESLTGKQIEQQLLQMAKDIMSKTYFMAYDKDIAYNALQRTSSKTPPAGVKQEFKDCAIWETMMLFSREMNVVDPGMPKLFYTRNTEDFCQKNSEPPVFLMQLTSEAITIGFDCYVKIEDVAARV